MQGLQLEGVDVANATGSTFYPDISKTYDITSAGVVVPWPTVNGAPVPSCGIIFRGQATFVRTGITGFLASTIVTDEAPNQTQHDTMVPGGTEIDDAVLLDPKHGAIGFKTRAGETSTVTINPDVKSRPHR